MFHSFLAGADGRGLIESARAHCDIPCAIYDPGPALIAAVSVVRLMDIMIEADKTETGLALHNALARNALRKEAEAETVKHEIRVIWGDYFKAPQIEAHPTIHALAHSIMQKASACKQGVRRADGEALVEAVNEFAQIYWQTKGVSTQRRPCPYAPALEVVSPT